MYQKILVPVDGSKLAECVLPHVEAIANGCKAKEVVFARVIEPAYPIDAHKKEAEDYLHDLVNRVKCEVTSVRSEVLVGNTAEKLVDYAQAKGVDLIIIATHGRSGIGRWVWGGIADRILRWGTVPVFMVRATEAEE
jgi:nucleotide-binding universal stress UspA family protein